jgi:hypothetical protein
MNDPREMRQVINKAAYGRERVDGKPMRTSGIPPAAALICAILNQARINGWSGEDAMTALAYHALVHYEGLHDTVLFDAFTQPSPSIIVLEPAEVRR